MAPHYHVSMDWIQAGLFFIVGLVLVGESTQRAGDPLFRTGYALIGVAALCFFVALILGRGEFNIWVVVGFSLAGVGTLACIGSKMRNWSTPS